LLPFGLLGLTLLMDRVERPLRHEDQLSVFLDSARPEELEAFVSEGYAIALERYWRRRARGLPGRSRR
jgi:hypothetical protein